MTRVLVVDDHPVVRAGMRMLLEAAAIDVIGEAATGEEAISWASMARPDLVLMDLQLGYGMDGVAATAALRALPDPPPVLIVTTYDTDADILRAVEAGAAGYLLKDTAPAELIDAVQRAAAGENVLTPVVADRLLASLRNPAPRLSERELDVLRLVAEGCSNRVVATRLFVTEATVKSHLVHIFDKLGVDSRTAAVSRARELGLLR
ncbi:response regulator transcription factor [Yimella sp. cx-51]|uniref:response regulator n=1 Tax=Yimella sp. cx-51 TaxID=2770551 RepID=UPI00165D5399|nr:response regulator transcription factor [Yimella sp. cx-51]MBC9955605.1 response regulator transcription factor [Yimella sp. cx-51]QTH37819.1 response regulator transcription factor [Yimella sp. cx-51]